MVFFGVCVNGEGSERFKNWKSYHSFLIRKMLQHLQSFQLMKDEIFIKHRLWAEHWAKCCVFPLYSSFPLLYHEGIITGCFARHSVVILLYV